MHNSINNNIHTCHICNQTIADVTSHLLHFHPSMTLQRYFQEYYNIPENTDYIIDENTLWKIVKELKNKNANDCIEHFKKIIAEVKNNIARLQFRFSNSAYDIYKYLNINVPKTTTRRKKHDMLSLQISIAANNKHTDVRTEQCPICGKTNKYGYMLWHAKSVHNIDKTEYLNKYFNIPLSVDMNLITYSLAKSMQEELKNSSYDNYEDCYQAIYDSFSNNGKMLEAYDYDINAICTALNINTNSQTLQAQLNQKQSAAISDSWKQGYREDIGFYVRSSWEANLARALEYEHIQYEYEKYRLPVIMPNNKVCHYTPDFYIGDNIFLEVKGRWRHDNKIKINMFKKQYPQYKLYLIDKYAYNTLQLYYKSLISNWE